MSIADAIEPNVIAYLLPLVGLFLILLVASLVPWKKGEQK